MSEQTPSASAWPPPVKTVVARHKREAAPLGLRVLCVEDDEQTLAVLSALLENEGYEVATATDAAQGLALLQRGGFHLLISDYWLPDRTGASMVREAGERGLLLNTAVIVVTAEHRPQGVENLKVLTKPLDLDAFLAVVSEELRPARESEVARVRRDLESKQKAAPASGAKAELVLYVSASSPSSLKALRNLERILAEYVAEEVRLTLCDLAKDDCALADEDHIAFTPTLVKRAPDPKIWVLGDLEKSDVVHDLLTVTGVTRLR